MTDGIVVLCTCADRSKAERIATSLVEERLCACVNILPGIESLYRWEGKLERSSEILLFIKTTQQRFEDLRTRLAELHSYDTPEIIALPITAGAESYLRWIHEQL